MSDPAPDPHWRPGQRAIEALLREHFRRIEIPDADRRAAQCVASLISTIGAHSVLLRHLTPDGLRRIFETMPPARGHAAGASGSGASWARAFLRAHAAVARANLQEPTTTMSETATETDMGRRPFRVQERDRDVRNALEMLAAPTDDEAADAYLPTRIAEALRTVFHAGNRHRGPKLADLRHIEHDLHAMYRTPKPGPDVRFEGAPAAAKRICRTVLNMSDPPPNRHVAYFTSQLRRAMAQAWDHGADETGRWIEASAKAIAEALAKHPTPTKPEQHALHRRARKAIET